MKTDSKKTNKVDFEILYIRWWGHDSPTNQTLIRFNHLEQNLLPTALNSFMNSSQLFHFLVCLLFDNFYTTMSELGKLSLPHNGHPYRVPRKALVSHQPNHLPFFSPCGMCTHSSKTTIWYHHLHTYNETFLNKWWSHSAEYSTHSVRVQTFDDHHFWWPLYLSDRCYQNNKKHLR